DVHLHRLRGRGAAARPHPRPGRDASRPRAPLPRGRRPIGHPGSDRARRRGRHRGRRVTRARTPQVFWRSGGRGPALVLLNGWSASGLAWPRTWLRELERDFRVIRVDNRGSGYSRFAPTPFTMTELADDVADVLDAADVDRAIVLGMSMGGMIAQEVAFRHGARL